ncbi:MAG: metalloregulator ArsR/SmtB family transcription factor [Tepidisphaeraceae bacterium]
MRLLPLIVERLAALADESRLRLLLTLKAGPANVGSLAATLGLGQASVSKHLAILRQAGIVEVRRVGTQSIYSVRDAGVFDLCGLLCDGVTKHLRDQHALLAPESSIEPLNH